MNIYFQKRVMIQALTFIFLFIASFVRIAGNVLFASKLIIKKEVNHVSK